MTESEKTKLEETRQELEKMLEIYEYMKDRSGINEKTSCIKLMEYTLKCCGYKFIINGKSNEFMNCNIYKLVSIWINL